MPWKERSVMEERMRFVLRLKDGESMASVCREFGISRVTGYKIYERYIEYGLQGLIIASRGGRAAQSEFSLIPRKAEQGLAL